MEAGPGRPDPTDRLRGGRFLPEVDSAAGGCITMEEHEGRFRPEVEVDEEPVEDEVAAAAG